MPIKNLEKKRAYQNQWMQDRRMAWIEKNGPCKSCGSTEDLEVDHINPEEKVSHRIWSWSEERRTTELKKCQVLCSKCHAIKTEAWYEKNRKHGTFNTWKEWKCRCALCVAVAKKEIKYSHTIIRKFPGATLEKRNELRKELGLPSI